MKTSCRHFGTSQTKRRSTPKQRDDSERRQRRNDRAPARSSRLVAGSPVTLPRKREIEMTEQSTMMVWVVAVDEFTAGYNAYWERRGPGVGCNRTRGWLAAAAEERRELAERAQDRLGNYNVAYGLI